MANKRLAAVILIILVEFLLLGVLIFDNYSILNYGVPISVEVNVENPCSRISASGVQFNCVGLEVSTPTLPESATLDVGDKVYATYKAEQNGNIQLDKYYLSDKEIPDGENYMEMRLASIEKVVSSNQQSGGEKESPRYILHLDAPFLKMNLSPVMLSRMEAIFRGENGQKPWEVHLQVRVREGKSALEELMIDGVPLKNLLDGQG